MPTAKCLRTFQLIDDISDGLCYMGAFLNPRLYCEIAAVNANARKILTFDSDVNIDSTNADDIASELAQILMDSVESAERQLAATEREPVYDIRLSWSSAARGV